MAQVLKDEVRARILEAALEVFAATGYRSATVGEIARRARVSTGNVYRYFPDKETLFYAVVPPTFAAEWRTLLRRRIRALDGVKSVGDLPHHAPFHAASEALLGFSIANRLRVVTLLAGSAGTRYDGTQDALVSELARLATAHYRSLGQRDPLPAPARFALEQVYRHWVNTMIEILARWNDERSIREAVAAFSSYHLSGLNGLLLDSGQ